MKIVDKFIDKVADNYNAPSVTIAFLGDSVTQGCFELYKKDDGNIETVFDKNGAYHAHLAEIFALLYPNVPVNIINAGISGDNAPHGLARIERDVISKSPDLAVVCFGLNDSGNGLDGIGTYINALKEIFKKLRENHIETIFMTPNMMNTKISVHLKDETERSIATAIMKTQTDGILDKYIEKAKELCAEENVRVCDCYAKWKRLNECGVDTTELLSNKINHPSREMNWLFAVSLVETMLS